MNAKKLNREALRVGVRNPHAGRFGEQIGFEASDAEDPSLVTCSDGMSQGKYRADQVAAYFAGLPDAQFDDERWQAVWNGFPAAVE